MSERMVSVNLSAFGHGRYRVELPPGRVEPGGSRPRARGSP